jgi:hypothetical protein
MRSSSGTKDDKVIKWITRLIIEENQRGATAEVMEDFLRCMRDDSEVIRNTIEGDLESKYGPLATLHFKTAIHFSLKSDANRIFDSLYAHYRKRIEKLPK